MTSMSMFYCGLFGVVLKMGLTELDANLKPGDRIEIYRAIIANPATVPRRQTAEDDD
jgi:putative ubiquitin-RnfH superfamily antitoxin RatB of RatAB toxin-antitoxin module